MNERNGGTIFEKYSAVFLERLNKEKMLKEHLSSGQPGTYMHTLFSGALSRE